MNVKSRTTESNEFNVIDRTKAQLFYVRIREAFLKYLPTNSATGDWYSCKDYKCFDVDVHGLYGSVHGLYGSVHHVTWN
jgi:hypothetical protein